ncbi:4a-hydroxytetrahydrobiopterin dehydratase [Alloacidobacterium sp.]|uniref:4a-hydroxytetrahydrobiopterin dehydratase n=1 Tax=Alloacidobacterium sp. TaxID=2951999 RepID=UPI002D713258|nr:4a-hydroxytetrahydrobiopterin dehydratase [Alloacidobacterium sp.]HYK37664.1 4a-hydroxytetrahydrobiopterin dehydratase [Alloacidobacterium sp.]
MPLIGPEAIGERLKQLPGWTLEGKEIVREFSFGDFVQALRFVNAVGEKAEAAGHHPDIDIRYNKVKLALTSHDSGGLTDRDFHMAEAVNAIPTKN